MLLLPNAKKCWLITKPEKEKHAKAMFEGTAINISTEGHQNLGAVLGSRKHLEDYVDEKVEDWTSQIVRLAEFAQSHPQASYVAFTFGLRHRWTYYLRTLPNIEDLLEPLERVISDVMIPSMVDHKCTQLERDILSFPVRLGGLGFTNPTQSANAEFQASVNVTAPLAERIMSHMNHLTKLKSHYYNERQRKKRRKDYSSDRTSGGILYPKERKELSV